MSVDRLQAASFCGSERERVQSAEGGWGSGAGNRSPRQPSFQGVKSKMAGETLLVALGATRKEQNSAVFLGLAPCLRGPPPLPNSLVRIPPSSFLEMPSEHAGIVERMLPLKPSHVHLVNSLIKDELH